MDALEIGCSNWNNNLWVPGFKKMFWYNLQCKIASSYGWSNMPSLKLIAGTWKWMVGVLFSLWEGLFFRGYAGFMERTLIQLLQEFTVFRWSGPQFWPTGWFAADFDPLHRLVFEVYCVLFWNYLIWNILQPQGSLNYMRWDPSVIDMYSYIYIYIYNRYLFLIIYIFGYVYDYIWLYALVSCSLFFGA